MAILTTLKQVSLPTGTTTIVSTDGAATTTSVAAELGAGKDPTNKAQALGAESDGRLQLSDAAGSLTIDGAVTANIGTTGTALTAATLTGGTAKAVVRSGARGSTGVADVTGTVEGADHQALDAQLYHAASTKDPTATRSLTSTDQVTVANASVAVTMAALPLPTGAATAARQPTLGTAGSPASTVTTIQAAVGMTALKVDGSATTQPVSGTVTVVVGSTGSLALDATRTGGTQNAIIRSGSKGASTSSDITSTAEGADHQALDVQLYHGGAAVDPRQVRALTSSDVATIAQGSAATLTAPWPVTPTDGTNTVPLDPVPDTAAYRTLTDGTSNVTVTASSATMVNGAGATQPVSGSLTINVSSPGTAMLDATLTSISQQSKLTDGSNTASTKAASTAAATTDKGLVAAAHPNSPIKQGTAAAVTSAWPIRPTDGTSASSVNPPSTAVSSTDLALVRAIHPLSKAKLSDGSATAAVKAASAAPATTDPALTVTISPNSAGVFSGTVTTNIGSSGSLALDATLSSNSVKLQTRGGAKGTTTAADATSTASGTSHQPLDVQIYGSNGGVCTGIQYASTSAQTSPSGMVFYGKYLSTNDLLPASAAAQDNFLSPSLATGTSYPTLTIAGQTTMMATENNSGRSLLISFSSFTGTLTPIASINGTIVPYVWYESSLSGSSALKYSTSLTPISNYTGSMVRSFPCFPGCTTLGFQLTTITSGSVSAVIPMGNFTGQDIPRASYYPGITTPTVSTASTTLSAANTLRQNCLVMNTSGATLFLNLGATAGTTPGSYSVQVAAGAREIVDNYHGAISAVLASGSGTITVTENF